MSKNKKHSHYFKDVSHLKEVDVYRVLSLFQVTDQAIGHAIKKLLVAGGRGVKDIDRDVNEAIDTLLRWKEMREEDSFSEPESTQQTIIDLAGIARPVTDLISSYKSSQ